MIMRKLSSMEVLLAARALLLCALLLAMPFLHGAHAAGSCLPAEEAALLKFKAGIKEDPDNLVQGWVKSTDCCTSWFGVVCDAHGHVVTLDLRPDPAFDEGVYLTGTISSSLASLPKLTYLDLSDLKNLSGALPEDLGKLKHLQHLDVRTNKLTGSIPSSFGSLTNLVFLSLGGNFLSGSIPASLGDLGPKLNYLYLSGGSLTGHIPASIFHLPNLTNLYLGSNQLSGGIPTDLSALATLQFLDLSGNKLSGKLPRNIGEQLIQLGSLDVSSNKFSGSIPASIGLISGLRFLGLNDNKFSGHIPAALAKLKNLVYANLASNRLTGPIPQGAPFSTIGNFDNNPGLCGSPLRACRRKHNL